MPEPPRAWASPATFCPLGGAGALPCPHSLLRKEQVEGILPGLMWTLCVRTRALEGSPIFFSFSTCGLSSKFWHSFSSSIFLSGDQTKVRVRWTFGPQRAGTPGLPPFPGLQPCKQKIYVWLPAKTPPSNETVPWALRHCLLQIIAFALILTSATLFCVMHIFFRTPF